MASAPGRSARPRSWPTAREDFAETTGDPPPGPFELEGSLLIAEDFDPCRHRRPPVPCSRSSSQQAAPARAIRRHQPEQIFGGTLSAIEAQNASAALASSVPRGA